MNQSIGLIILQFFGIVLGLVSVFWVAGSVPAEIYAIVGIYQVISSFVIIFSNTGLETHAIRNVLAWKEANEVERIKVLITQAIGLRILMATLIFIPIIGYAFYISSVKFGGQHITLFILMGLFSIFSAINDSIASIFRAFNRYFYAALLTYAINVFGNLLALLLFIKFGFSIYIGTIILLPLIIAIPIIYIIRKWISIKYIFNRKMVLEQLMLSKTFAFSAYISYLFNFIDQFLVSIFLTPEVIGSFTIGKKLMSIAKTFIENIFDPLIQNLVKFKNKEVIFKNNLEKIFKIRNILLALSLLILPIFFIYLDKAIDIMRLIHYPFLNYFLITIFFAQIAHIGMKVKYNIIALFYAPAFYLKLTIINAMLSIVFLSFFMLWNTKFIFGYIVLTNLLMMLYTSYLYKVNHGMLYPCIQRRPS